MSSIVRLVVDVVIIFVVGGLIFYLYDAYKEKVSEVFFGEEKVGLMVRDVGVSAFVADDDEERAQGLSGREHLNEEDGMLFVFDEAGIYSFWMKDTLIPLDIMWIDDGLKIVHIEKNVRPETYPASYRSPVPARFVLEVNAFFADTFNIKIGDRITIPAHRLPADLR